MIERIGRFIPAHVRRRVVKLAQRECRRSGYSLVRSPQDAKGSPDWDVWHWLATRARVRTILDIGANDGEFGAYLSEIFKPAALHAFEPLGSSRAALDALRSRIPHLTVHDVALSDETGAATFFENDYGPASSLLPISDDARHAYPQTDQSHAVSVRVARLDDILPVTTLERDILIKIDVQGVEDRVIRGGKDIFSAASIVLIEMSFVPFYVGQPLFGEVHAQLEGCGLVFAGIKNQISDPSNGRPMFAHCLYVRPSDADDMARVDPQGHP